MSKSLRGKSAARRPLVDVTNGGAARRPPAKGSFGDGDDEGVLDRLLLVRSDLADLVGQIDELVAKAVEHKTANRKGSKDIDAFRNVLSDMHSTLKVWFSRLQQTLTASSIANRKHFEKKFDAMVAQDETGNKIAASVTDREPELELVVSPSPLVSWRAGACTVDCGKQLFLLTPLPKPKAYGSRFPETSKTLIRELNDKRQFNHHNLSQLPTCDNNIDCMSGVAELIPPSSSFRNPYSSEQKYGASERVFPSASNFSLHKNEEKPNSLSTPFTQKSSALLNSAVKKPLRPEGVNGPKLAEDIVDRNGSDDPTSADVPEALVSNYQDLLEQQPAAAKFGVRRKEVDDTLNWFLSPPKTCVLMEPSEEKKPLPTPAKLSFCTTPVWRDIESSFKSKQAGEATLKRELWTRFDAVSSSGLHFDVSVFQKTGRKGFLDMLEEVSCENASSDAEVATQQ